MSSKNVTQEQGERRIRKICGFLTPAACAAPVFKKLLVVNRGEIACRIMRGCKALGIPTVAIYAAADAEALHRETADEAFEVKAPAGREADAIAPYLNIDEVIRVAKEAGCDAAHPGYGFLAESEAFAAACASNGVKFVGPESRTIGLFGDKTEARALAIKHGVSVAAGSGPVKTAEEAIKFVEDNKVPYPVLVKAAFGGGGRGQRLVHEPSELAASLDSCVKEATMAFGDGTCFIEEFVSPGRHIEIQVLGDGPGGNAVHFFERDCSVQLRNQKVVEIAPARDIHPELRKKLTDSALALAKATKYEGLGTVEFLVSGELTDPDARHIFLEVNPRIQVEHTITEQITGVDLLQQQIQIAAGATLPSLGLTQDKISYAGWAIQSRVCLMPGKEAPLSKYQEPVGDGIRVDTGVAQGKTPSGKYDPLLAKLICSVGADKSFEDCVELSLSSLASYTLDGVKSNKNQLTNILSHPAFAANKVYTAFMGDYADELGNTPPKKRKKSKKKAAAPEGPPTSIAVCSPFPGQVAEIKVKVGDKVEPGQTVAVVSAMKMLNDVPSPGVGVVTAIGAAIEEQIDESVALITIEGHLMSAEEEEDDFEDSVATAAPSGGGGGDAAYISRAWAADEATYGVYGRSAPRIRSKVKTDTEDFKDREQHNLQLAAELQERLDIVKQGGGGKYVKLHRSRGKLLARERIEAIIDPGSRFMELSALAAWGLHDERVFSAGMVTGVGLVHGRECMFLANDATVKGGVFFNETAKKQLRAQEIAETNLLPCIYLVDGGGANLAALGDEAATVQFVMGGIQFKNQAVMSSKKIPQISAVLGRCTAGGAYIPAMSDETVQVKGNGQIYLGGPALVKAATGEEANEEDLGGANMHCTKSGVTDHFAETEEDALHKVRCIVENLARLPKVQLPLLVSEPPAYSAEELMGVIPKDTKIPFDVREVIARIVDGSRFHEFKPRYGTTLVCGWAHIHGYPIGILGNNGMLFSESAIKAAHFIENCGQRGTPLLFLHNITGFIIGTKYEQGGITKDGAKMIMAVSCAPVPKFSVVLAGSHGAGNYAMCGPAFDPRFTFLWPNAKISVMGGKQAADVITTVKDGQLKREGKPPLTPEQVEMMQEPIIDAFESTNSAYHSTANIFDDGVIDPRETRDVLGMAISISLNAPKMTNSYGVFRM